MNEIVIFPVSGLGNRIASIEAAICLAENNKFDQVTILWDKTTVPCPFAELLSVTSDKCDLIVKEIPGGDKTLLGRVVHGLSLRLYSLGCSKEIPFLNGAEGGRLTPDAFPKGGRIFIKACTEFYPFNSIEHVAFSEKDRMKATESLPNGKRCIGVHIRRGDNQSSSRVSRTELFIKRMREEIEKDNEVTFFLATDDKDVEKHLQNEFGDCIYLQREKKNERFTTRGQHEAAVDMSALSKTEFILGSFYSSFTDMAAKMGNVYAEIIE